MDDADRITLVALLVSLVALFIALVQMLLALFSTAEGFRRCNKAVIGPWADLTRWPIRWTQLRMEVTFETPDIDLYDLSRTVTSSTAAGELQGVISRTSRLKQRRMIVLERTVTTSENDRPSMIRMFRRMTGCVLERFGHRNSADCCSEETQVSWIPFLRQLHSYYTDSAIVDQKRRITMLSSQLHRDTKFSMSHSEDPEKTSQSPPPSSLSGSCVGIRFSQRSWDNMPPDVVRPMAHTYLGPLVVLAVRLGMSWRTFDFDKDNLSASGNGFSLTSAQVRGVIGTVFQFSEDYNSTEHCHSLQLIKSQASDKMICGRLPLDTHLAGTIAGLSDIPLMGNGKLSFRLIRQFLSNLGVNQDIQQELSGDGYCTFKNAYELIWHRCQFNEALMLLCCFLPVQGSTHRRVRYLGWLGKRPTTIFTYHESRIVLLDIIKRRVELAGPKNEMMWKAVSDALANLERDFPDAWYGWYDDHNSHACRTHGRQSSSESNLVERCRKVFDETTVYLQSIKDNYGIKYQTLVAAHLSWGFRMGEKAKEEYDKASKKSGWSGSVYLDHHKKWPRPAEIPENAWHPGFSAIAITDLAWKYTENVGEFCEEVVRRSPGCVDLKNPNHLSALEIAWWHMMLRGIAWALSVEIETPCGDWAELPASIYNDRRPVWMA